MKLDLINPTIDNPLAYFDFIFSNKNGLASIKYLFGPAEVLNYPTSFEYHAPTETLYGIMDNADFPETTFESFLTKDLFKESIITRSLLMEKKNALSNHKLFVSYLIGIRSELNSLKYKIKNNSSMSKYSICLNTINELYDFTQEVEKLSTESIELQKAQLLDKSDSDSRLNSIELKRDCFFKLSTKYNESHLEMLYLILSKNNTFISKKLPRAITNFKSAFGIGKIVKYPIIWNRLSKNKMVNKYELFFLFDKLHEIEFIEKYSDSLFEQMIFNDEKLQIKNVENSRSNYERKFADRGPVYPNITKLIKDFEMQLKTTSF